MYPTVPRLNFYNYDLSDRECIIVDIIVNDIFYQQTHLDNVKKWNQIYEIPTDVNGERLTRSIKRTLKAENLFYPVELSENGRYIVCTLPPWIDAGLYLKYEGSHGRAIRDTDRERVLSSGVCRTTRDTLHGIMKRCRSV